MLKVKEIEMNDVFTLTEIGFENTHGTTFCKDYEDGFSLVINPRESHGKEKVKINFLIEKLDECDSEIDCCCDMSEVYDDISELIRKGIVVYE